MNNSPWQVFEGLKTLQDYKPSEIEAFADRLFSSQDEETILSDYCFLQDCINILESIKNAIKPTITQIVLNQPKSFEIAGYKFTYRAQTKYDYAFCQLWREANESVKLNQDYQKQIEEICKKGGRINGVDIEKVPVEVIDNFAMSKIK